MISIIIPIYNQSEHLANCLASIKKQTYDNYEIIIVNDGSTDNILPVIANFKKLFGFKLSYFEQENQGANIARNRGAKSAKGEYIIFCDADVVMEPIMLELMQKSLKENPNVSFCYSSFMWGRKKFKLWTYDPEKLKQLPYISINSLIKRDIGVWLNKILFKVSVGGTQTMSKWLPSFAYKLFPFLPAVKKYNQAKEIIKKKHNL